MRYIVIDTNIFIDMIIDRRHNVNSKLVESFIKLLDFDEVRIVIPGIVVHETNKHLEEQLAEVGKKINHAIKAIEEIYGVNGYTIDGLEISDYKKNSKSELIELLDKYNANKGQYLVEIQNVVTKIFEHRNCIVIPDTEELRSLCFQRRVYKRAPFHHENKESYADGLIVETLLQMGSIVHLSSGDSILFVSGNTADFSDNTDKQRLHEDIVEDLRKNELIDKVQYILKFNQLIGKELRGEVERAHLKEEFERELQEQDEAEMAFFDAEIDDMERESVGLSPLGNFEEEFCDSFSESKFAEKFTSLLERINSCYSALEEISYFYSEELKPYVTSISCNEVINMIRQWNAVFSKIGICEVTDDIYGIINILEWIDDQAANMNYLNVAERLPDTLNYGDHISFYSKDRKKYELIMDELYLTCENGDIDWLDMKLISGKDIRVTGRIEITYGFVEFDEDGGIQDACDQDISYMTDDIVEFIETLVDEFEKFVAGEQEKVDVWRDKFNFSTQ